MSLFDAIADERRQLAGMLAPLSQEQLQTPSWCPPWTVGEVAAHLVLPFRVGRGEALWSLVVCGFDFDRWAERMTAKLAGIPFAELVGLLERNAETRFVPPGAGPEAPLSELLVHGLDIRRPLGIPRVLPPDRVRVALDFLGKSPARGFVKATWRRDLRFEASDLDWSHGEGPLVRGTSDSLMLALTGRRQVLPELQGDGVAVLRSRFG